jgi:hypothetical protein
MTDKQQSLLTDEVSVQLSLAMKFGAVGFNGEMADVKCAGAGR